MATLPIPCFSRKKRSILPLCMFMVANLLNLPAFAAHHYKTMGISYPVCCDKVRNPTWPLRYPKILNKATFIEENQAPAEVRESLKRIKYIRHFSAITEPGSKKSKHPDILYSSLALGLKSLTITDLFPKVSHAKNLKKIELNKGPGFLSQRKLKESYIFSIKTLPFLENLTSSPAQAGIVSRVFQPMKEVLRYLHRSTRLTTANIHIVRQSHVQIFDILYELSKISSLKKLTLSLEDVQEALDVPLNKRELARLKENLDTFVLNTFVLNTSANTRPATKMAALSSATSNVVGQLVRFFQEKIILHSLYVGRTETTFQKDLLSHLKDVPKISIAPEFKNGGNHLKFVYSLVNQCSQLEEFCMTIHDNKLPTFSLDYSDDKSLPVSDLKTVFRANFSSLITFEYVGLSNFLGMKYFLANPTVKKLRTLNIYLTDGDSNNKKVQLANILIHAENFPHLQSLSWRGQFDLEELPKDWKNTSIMELNVYSEHPITRGTLEKISRIERLESLIIPLDAQENHLEMLVQVLGSSPCAPILRALKFNKFNNLTKSTITKLKLTFPKLNSMYVWGLRNESFKI